MEDSHQISPSVTDEEHSHESKQPASEVASMENADQVQEVLEQLRDNTVDQPGEAEVNNAEDASIISPSKSQPETSNSEPEMLDGVQNLSKQSNSSNDGDDAVANTESTNVQTEVENNEVVDNVACSVNDSAKINCDYYERVDTDSDSGLTFSGTPCKPVDCEVTSTDELLYPVTSLDCNNNCTSRADTVITPDNDFRGISPEIFFARHMSPTELYGKDHLIGAPRIMTRPPSRQSTLNTPDPVYAEEDEADEAFLCHNRGVKRGITEVADNENPVPCGFTDSFYQPNSSSFLRPDATYMSGGMFVPQPSSTAQNYTPGQQSFCRDTKSRAAYRLDFSSPVDMCNSAGITNPVNFNSFYNMNQPYSSSSIPAFVPNQPFLPAHISRPLPIIPVMPSYPPYSFSQLDVNCNPCPPVSVLPYNPHTAFYSPVQAHSAASTNYPASYTNISPAAGSSPAYPSYGTQSRLNRTDQRTQNLNYTEFYTSTHQTSLSNTNQTQSNGAPRYQSYRLGGIRKRNQVIEDQINNNMNTRDNTEKMALDLRCRMSSKESKGTDKATTDGSKGDAGKSKNSMTVEESIVADIEAYNEGMINWRNRNAKVPVALKTRDKKVYVSVSELGRKSVKQLLDTAGETTDNVTDPASSPAPRRTSSLVYNEAFIQKFKEERKTKSPMSAFCAALDEPKKSRTPVRITAEPRIPIPSLLLPNEVPMMFNGQTMVPYFQTGLVPATSGATTASIAGELPRGLPAQYTGRTHLGLLDNFTLTSNTTASAPSVAGQTAAHSLGRPIAPAPVSTPAVPVYPTGCGQIPLVAPMVATPLYQQLPDPAPAASRSWHTPSPWSDTQQQAHSRPASTPEIGIGVSKEMQPTNRAQDVGGVSFAAVPGSAKKPASQTRCWKAKHYGFSQLTIGTYKYTGDPNGLDRAARMKLLFRKRRLVYEYQVNTSEASTGSKRIMAEIVIPFDTIVGLALDHKEMRVEVSEAPVMYGGVRGPERNTSGGHQSTIYNRKKTVDYTRGQLKSSPYHRLQFKTPCSAKLREDFEEFDARFKALLQREFVENKDKILRDVEELVRSYLVDPELQPVVRTPAVTVNPASNPTWTATDVRATNMGRRGGVCDCVEGCSSTSSCACCAGGARCTADGCTCLACHNPLNVLHNMGVPADRAVTDPCLMDNIYKISQLNDYIKTPLTLDCCQTPILLFNCIPGLVSCPSLDCGATYKFSWCSAQMCDDVDSPRNHCEKCHRCTDFRDVHCPTCNVCYFAGEHGSFKCSACHSPEEVLDSSSSDTD